MRPPRKANASVGFHVIVNLMGAKVVNVHVLESLASCFLWVFFFPVSSRRWAGPVAGYF